MISDFEKIGPYSVCGKVGEGGFAIVSVIEDPITKTRFAVKSMKICEKNTKAILKEIEMEFIFYKDLIDPYLLRYHCFFMENTYTHFLMEYCSNGDLKKWIENLNRPLKEKEVICLLTQIVYGISALHKRNIIHRDIKPQNILLNEHLEVKIADFGISKELLGEPMATTTQGTIGFVPAEGEFSKASDMFAVGCTAYFMMTRRFPFAGETMYQVLMKTMKGEYTPIPEESEYSAGLIKLVHDLLDKDPKARPTAEQLKTHPSLLPALPLPPRHNVPPAPLLFPMETFSNGVAEMEKKERETKAENDRLKAETEGLAACLEGERGEMAKKMALWETERERLKGEIAKVAEKRAELEKEGVHLRQKNALLKKAKTEWEEERTQVWQQLERMEKVEKEKQEKQEGRKKENDEDLSEKEERKKENNEVANTEAQQTSPSTSSSISSSSMSSFSSASSMFTLPSRTQPTGQPPTTNINPMGAKVGTGWKGGGEVAIEEPGGKRLSTSVPPILQLCKYCPSEHSHHIEGELFECWKCGRVFLRNNKGGFQTIGEFDKLQKYQCLNCNKPIKKDVFLNHIRNDCALKRK